jgi:hypothetical protein
MLTHQINLEHATLLDVVAGRLIPDQRIVLPVSGSNDRTG